MTLTALPAETLSHPVTAAVEPAREKAIERAAKFAAERVEQIKAELEANDWDVNATAPYPNASRCDRREYKMGQAKHALVHSLVQADASRKVQLKPWERSDHHPEYVVMSDEGVARFIEQARQAASTDYDAYILKLVEKVGEVKTAVMVTTSNVWNVSYVIVTDETGQETIWKTQQIINVSVLGKLFNQYPTRKVKEVK